MKKKTVLIVGAGPTGLTAGVELQRRGINATVIDRRDQASSFSRAVGILPISLQLLEPSGVTATLLKEGMKFNFARIYNKTIPLLNVPLEPRHIKHGYDFILGLAQDRTESSLHDRFVELGGKVHYHTEFKSLEDKGNHVTVGMETELPSERVDEKIAPKTDYKSENYDFVIGADGIHSAVREQLGIAYPGIDLPETWSIADVDANDWPNIDAFTVCLLDDAKVAVVAPLEPNRFRVISNTPNALDSLPLALNVTSIHRQGEFNISIRQVQEYQKGNVFLAGDSAHCHSPVGGRGMNLGIADAVELAKRLSENTHCGYGAVRHAEGKRVIAGSERARRLITSPSNFKRGLAKSILAVIGYIPFMRRIFVQNILYG